MSGVSLSFGPGSVSFHGAKNGCMSSKSNLGFMQCTVLMRDLQLGYPHNFGPNLYLRDHTQVLGWCIYFVALPVKNVFM